MVDASKLTITQVDQITTFNNADELEFIMDEIQEATISNSQEKTDITGKGGRKISSLKKNKAVTITATNGFLVGGAFSAQTGSDVQNGTYKVRKTDVIIVNNNKGTTSAKAVGTTGAEIGIIYKKDKVSGALGETLTQAATASEGKFAYNPENNEITFSDGELADGTEVVAFYDVEVIAAKISNDSETYSKVLKTYIDVTCQDPCDNVYHGQFIIQRGDFSGEFEITMGNDPAVHSIEIESLAGGCTGSNNLWDFIVF